MVKRTKLRQVVSAVYHLNRRDGVKTSEVGGYLRRNYGMVASPNYQRALKHAVTEGFLMVKGNRYHPVGALPAMPVPGALVMRRRRKGRSRKGRSRRRRRSMNLGLMARRRRRGSRSHRRRRRGRGHTYGLAMRRHSRRKSHRRRRRGRRFDGYEDLVMLRRRRRGGRSRSRRRRQRSHNRRLNAEASATKTENNAPTSAADPSQQAGQGSPQQ